MVGSSVVEGGSVNMVVLAVVEIVVDEFGGGTVEAKQVSFPDTSFALMQIK